MCACLGINVLTTVESPWVAEFVGIKRIGKSLGTSGAVHGDPRVHHEPGNAAAVSVLTGGIQVGHTERSRSAAPPRLLVRGRLADNSLNMSIPSVLSPQSLDHNPYEM